MTRSGRFQRSSGRPPSLSQSLACHAACRPRRRPRRRPALPLPPPPPQPQQPPFPGLHPPPPPPLPPTPTHPAPTPPPAPTLTPAPPPTATCTAALADVEQFRVAVKPHGGQLLDVTVWACGPRLVASLNSCGAACCPLAFEKGPVNQACSLDLYGPPTFSSDTLGLVVSDNPWTVKVAEGDGLLRVSPSVPESAGVSGAIRVLHAFKGIPACDQGPDGNCK